MALIGVGSTKKRRVEEPRTEQTCSSGVYLKDDGAGSDPGSHLVYPCTDCNVVYKKPHDHFKRMKHKVVGESVESRTLRYQSFVRQSKLSKERLTKNFFVRERDVRDGFETFDDEQVEHVLVFLQTLGHKVIRNRRRPTQVGPCIRSSCGVLDEVDALSEDSSIVNSSEETTSAPVKAKRAKHCYPQSYNEAHDEEFEQPTEDVLGLLNNDDRQECIYGIGQFAAGTVEERCFNAGLYCALKFEQHDLLQQFYESYLNLSFKGNTWTTQPKQHFNRVKRMLCFMQYKAGLINSELSVDGCLHYSKFLFDYLTTYGEINPCSTTIRTYEKSLSKWFDFLRILIDPVEVNKIAILDAMNVRLRTVGSLTQRGVRADLVRTRQEKERRCYPSLAEVLEVFNKSEVRQSIRSILDSNRAPTDKEYNYLLGYIVSRLVIKAAQRPSVVEGWKVEEFLAKKMKDSFYYSTISTHKNAPAAFHIIFTPDDDEALCYYYSNCRPDSDSRELLLYKSSSNIQNHAGEIVKNWFKSIGLPQRMIIGPTDMRRIVDSKSTLELSPAECALVCEYVGHSNKTKKKFYERKQYERFILAYKLIEQLAAVDTESAYGTQSDLDAVSACYSHRASVGQGCSSRDLEGHVQELESRRDCNFVSSPSIEENDVRHFPGRSLNGDTVKSHCSHQTWPGLRIATGLPERNRGVFTTRLFKRNEIICDFAGTEMSENEYNMYLSTKPSETQRLANSYVMEYAPGKVMVAHREDEKRFGGRLSYGRLINHTMKHVNCKPRLIRILDSGDAETEHIVMVATKDIPADTELLWFYSRHYKDEVWFFTCWCGSCSGICWCLACEGKQLHPKDHVKDETGQHEEVPVSQLPFNDDQYPKGLKGFMKYYAKHNRLFLSNKHSTKSHRFLYGLQEALSLTGRTVSCKDLYIRLHEITVEAGTLLTSWSSLHAVTLYLLEIKTPFVIFKPVVDQSTNEVSKLVGQAYFVSVDTSAPDVVGLVVFYDAASSGWHLQYTVPRKHPESERLILPAEISENVVPVSQFDSAMCRATRLLKKDKRMQTARHI